MARPLPTNNHPHTLPLNSYRRWSAAGAVPPSGQLTPIPGQLEANGNGLAGDSHPGVCAKPVGEDSGDSQEMEALRQENNQLRGLCVELEHALQQAAQLGQGDTDERLREYESLLAEKDETIRQMQQDMEQARVMLAEMDARLQEMEAHRPAGPTPREEELLALSEELEQERRQLQEDERTLMDQMREMEVTMARERAEMARQRNDHVRLQNEIRHELERLERSGAAVRKMEELKTKLSDVSNRRGMAAGSTGSAASQQPAPPQSAPPKKDGNSLMGRLFGR